MFSRLASLSRICRFTLVWLIH